QLGPLAVDRPFPFVALQPTAGARLHRLHEAIGTRAVPDTQRVARVLQCEIGGVEVDRVIVMGLVRAFGPRPEPPLNSFACIRRQGELELGFHAGTTHVAEARLLGRVTGQGYGQRYETMLRGTSRNGLSVSTLCSLGILSTRSEMMLRWISSVPPAIEPAGTDTRISAMTPSIGLSSPLKSALAPVR